MSTPASTFPGGTSVTFLDVYDDAAPDGVRGGSPHVHLVSTECYVVVGGAGELHTVDPSGWRRTPLAVGSVIWFTPGTIHRAVNHGDLRVLVVMSNSGLPEAGDAIMTFPPAYLADAQTYAAAAVLPARASLAERAADARRRRDLAVEGFLALRDAAEAGDPTPLRNFSEAARRLVSARAEGWDRIVRERPLAQAELSVAHVAAVVAGSPDHLAEAAMFHVPASEGERGFGMCGRLRTYDIANAR